MTQEQLGDATGLTSVHVNRTIRALEAEGLIHCVTHAQFRLVIGGSWPQCAISIAVICICLATSPPSNSAQHGFDVRFGSIPAGFTDGEHCAGECFEPEPPRGAPVLR